MVTEKEKKSSDELEIFEMQVMIFNCSQVALKYLPFFLQKLSKAA